MLSTACSSIEKSKTRGKKMKQAGIVAIFIGVILGLFAFNMDTSIEAGGKNLGTAEYPIMTPKIRVNNFGLMQERQNYLTAAGFIFLAGVILFGVASLNEGREQASYKSRICPNCSGLLDKNDNSCPTCRIKKQHSAIQTETVQAFNPSVTNTTTDTNAHKHKYRCPECGFLRSAVGNCPNCNA